MASLLFCLSIPLLGQDYGLKFDHSNQSITFDTVFVFEGMTKDEIFTNANIWLSDYFNDSESVIEFSDKEQGVITCNGLNQFASSLGGIGGFSEYIKFYLKIMVKDEKGRLIITDLRYKANNKYNTDNDIWMYFYNKKGKEKNGFKNIKKAMFETIYSLKKSMPEGIIAAKKNDESW